MAVLAVLALFGGHALAQWMSFPKPMYVGEIAELTWDLSNEEGLEAPWTINFTAISQDGTTDYESVIRSDASTSETIFVLVPYEPSTDYSDMYFKALDHAGLRGYAFHSVVIKERDSAATSDSSSLNPVGTPTVAEPSTSIITMTSTTTEDASDLTNTSDRTTTHTIDMSADVADAPTDLSPNDSSTTSQPTDASSTLTPTTPDDNPTQTPDPPSTPPKMSTSALAGTLVASFLLFISLLTLTLAWIHRRGRRKRLNATDSNPEADVASQPEVAELDSPSTPPSAWRGLDKGLMNGGMTGFVPLSTVTLRPGIGATPLSPAEREDRGWERGGVAVHELSADGAVSAQQSGMECRGREMAEHGTRSLGMDETDSPAGAMGEVGVARMVWVGPRRTV